MTKFPLRLILSNIRSIHNVGSLLRTADAAGVELVYACGYTPHPLVIDDPRPPHVARSVHQRLHKTALGAEATMAIRVYSDTLSACNEAKRDGFTLIVLEQSENSLNLYDTSLSGPTALLLGNEVDGVEPTIQAQADSIVEIPMVGRKESLNVSVAGAIALYQLRFGY